MDRSPLFLAALASAAVPGLDPASVEPLAGAPNHQYDVAFVQDTQHRRWVIRVPRSQAAAAQMESTFSLLALLGRRLPFSVPTPKGFAALKEGGRAAIYPYLPGQNIDFASLPPGPGLAAELGRAIATLHNTDHALFEEAGLPAYDADTYRTRRLTELDRAASTGHVPTGLLTRWEKALEDVAIWRFAPTPTHGDLTGDQVLVVFDDEGDAASGRVKALTGWEDAKVADPADDFFALVDQASPGALETVLEAYAHARAERPDPHLLTRARLGAQMGPLAGLMAAMNTSDRLLLERNAAALRRLEDALLAEEQAADDYRRPGNATTRPAAPLVVPPVVPEDDDEDAEDEDVALMFGQSSADETVNDDGTDDLDDEPDHEPDDEIEDHGLDAAPDGPLFAEVDDEPDDPHTRDEVTTELHLGAVPPAAAQAGPPEPHEPHGPPAPVEGPDPGPEFEPGYSEKA